MRALIKIHIAPKNALNEIWLNGKTIEVKSNDPEREPTKICEDYYEGIIKIFREVGYTAQKTYADNLARDQYVNRIFKNVPPDIKEHEMKHLAMTGYTSDGQAHFVVAIINPAEIHVRIQADVFVRLRKACEQFYKKFRQSDGYYNRHFYDRLFIRNKDVKSQIKVAEVFSLDRLKDVAHIDDKTNIRLHVVPIIEVIEPNRDHATIEGKIIDKPLREVAKANFGEVVISAFSITSAIILFFVTPSFVPIIEKWPLFHGFSRLYISGALERIYSALLVTFVISSLEIFWKATELKRFMPIKWNSFNNPWKS